MRNPSREGRPASRSTVRIDAEGCFSGYASLFDVVDLCGDAVAKGAFAASLARRGRAGIRMLYQHDPAQPLGRWLEIREDSRGLHVRGMLAPGVARAREVLQLMRAGALDGLSIGFRTLRSRRDADTRIRRILEADLWEISIVTFPMLPGARVETVKALRPRPGLPEAIRRAARLFTQEKRPCR